MVVSLPLKKVWSANSGDGEQSEVRKETAGWALGSSRATMATAAGGGVGVCGRDPKGSGGEAIGIYVSRGRFPSPVSLSTAKRTTHRPRTLDVEAERREDGDQRRDRRAQ